MRITVPSRALKYLLYQRTGLDEGTFLWRATVVLVSRLPFLEKPMVALRCLLNRRVIEKNFDESITTDYEQMRSSLPDIKNPTIVDIGCGVAGTDIRLSEHYEHGARFILVDKTKVDRKIWYKFEKEGSFYNSMDVARSLLQVNGVSGKNIVTMTPDDFYATKEKADLVISLISWGHHYPVSTYLAKVREVLKPGGTLILDVRKGQAGEEELKKYAATYAVIADDRRSSRVAMTMKT